MGLSSGDIYFGEDAFGYYLGYWQPNLKRPAYLVVFAVNERLETVACLGVELLSDNGLHIRPVASRELPWGEDYFDEYVDPEKISSSMSAAKALDLVADIVANDVGLAKYLLDETIRYSGTY